jgi:cell division protein WhiA
MSFAQDVKQEILQTALEPCEALPFLSALYRMNGRLEDNRLVFKSVSLGLVRRIRSMVKERYGLDAHVSMYHQKQLKKQKMYECIVTDAEEMLNDLGLLDGSSYGGLFDDLMVLDSCAKVGFLKGAFLATGSINSPESSSYHLEISAPQKKLIEGICHLFDSLEVPAKTLKKKNNRYLVYVKESEKIADFLRLMGATESLFTFEDERIKRDFYNSITRVLNIELANQNKTLQAADKQLKNIAILENLTDTEEFPPGIIEAIKLRRKYPELSLVELSMKSEEEYHKPISKSGLNHRFREIERLANEAMEVYHAKSDRH